MGLLNRTKALATKAVSDITEYLNATVTVRDRSQSAYSRNLEARALLQYARGYVMNCANIVALAGSQQPLRLYRTGSVTIRTAKGRAYKPGLKAVSRSTEQAMRGGRFGRKAATWSGMGGNVAEVVDHPALDLITRPNPLQNGESFDYQALLFAQIAGEMFTLVEGRSAPTALWPMLPQYTQPMPDVEGVIGGFAYGRERSAVVEYDAADVLHFKYADHTENPYHGMGPLHWCYQAARIVAENEDFDLEFIDRGNLPLAFVSLDPTHYATDDNVKDFKKYLTKATRGAMGKTQAIVGVGMSVTSPAQTARDLQTLEKLREHKATIRQAFGVSESLLELNSANLASASVGDDQFWGMTVRPLLNKRADHLTEVLLPMFGLEPGEYYFAYDDPLLSDREKEARVASVEIGMGALSINEYRAGLNMDSIGEEGDVYRINGVPVDQSGQALLGGFGGFGSPSLPMPTDEPDGAEQPEAQVPAQKIEETALNGAQIAQLVAIAERVAQGIITREAGFAIAAASFPGTPEDKLRDIFDRLTEVEIDPETGAAKARKPGLRVPVLGTLDAKGTHNDRDNRDAGSGGRSMEASDSGAAGNEAENQHDGPVAGHSDTLGAGGVCAVKLADRHARPDPYDLRDCGCGLTTKDDDDDKQPPVTINPPPGLNLTREQAIAFAAQQRVLQGAVGSLRGIIEDFMRDAQEEAARSILAGGSIDLGTLEDQLASVLEPEFRTMYRAGFDLGALELGEDATVDPFSLPNAEAIAEAETSLIRQLSKDITDHTAQGIESRVRAGIEAGEGIDDIAKAIEGDTGFAQYRAERIARTEVSNAANMGKLARYKEAGVTLKYWIPGTSAVHRALGEMFKEGVPLDEPFLRAGQTVTAGGVTETYTRDVMAPPARPNCTCTMAARPLEDA